MSWGRARKRGPPGEALLRASLYNEEMRGSRPVFEFLRCPRDGSPTEPAAVS